MQSANLRQIKITIREQAFTGQAWVPCTIGSVVAVRRRKGLLVMIRGWSGRWYPVNSVKIEYTGRQRSRVAGNVVSYIFSLIEAEPHETYL